MTNGDLAFLFWLQLSCLFFIEPIVNLGHQKSLAFFRRITRNLIENEENKVIKDDYERLLRLSLKKEEELEKAKKIDKEAFRGLLRHISIQKQNIKRPNVNCYIFRSNEDFKNGAHVSYSVNDKRIVPYTRSLNYAGKVEKKLKDNLFLVYYDYSLTEEINFLKSNRPNLHGRRIFLNEEGTQLLLNPKSEYEKDRVIINYQDMANIIPAINKMDDKFFESYIETIDEYLYDKGLPKEQKRLFIFKLLLEITIYPFKSLFIFYIFIKRKFTSNDNPSQELSSNRVSNYNGKGKL